LLSLVELQTKSDGNISPDSVDMDDNQFVST
jgi:hypothetical protein